MDNYYSFNIVFTIFYHIAFLYLKFFYMLYYLKSRLKIKISYFPTSSMKQFLLSIIPFIGFLFGHLFVWYIQKPKGIICPSFTGLSFLNASIEAANHKVNIRIRKLITENTLPHGTIIDQYPKEKTLIKEQQIIYVLVSVAPLPHYAPSLIRKKINDIQDGPDCNLIKIHMLHNPAITSDTIFAQSPPPGKPVHDSKIKVYVSKQNEPVYIMPLCIGHTLKDVAELFELYQIPYTCNHPVNEKSIIKNQNPIPGSLVFKNKLKMVYLHC